MLTETPDIIGLLNEIIVYIGENSIEKRVYEKIALQIAKNYAKYSKTTLNNEETEQLINSLFRCQTPNFSLDGKKIIAIIYDEEIIEKFL
jgi:DNA mismatch repair protein MutL